MKQLTLALALLWWWTAPIAAQSLTVRTLAGTSQEISLAGLTTHRVAVQENSLKRVYEGVLLRDLLARAGVPLGEHLRGPALRQYVVAVGQDGYAAVIALAEVDQGFTNEQILVATGHDGHGLIPDHGPLRLIVPHDKRAARWVRQVVRIEVHQAP